MASPNHHHHLLLLLFILLLLSIINMAAGQRRGNITLNSSLVAAGNLSWSSLSGDFAFGFIPLPTNSSLFLLATYFSNLPNTTIIWTPNRNKPVGPNSTVFLTPDGFLSLRDPTGAELWNPSSTNAAYASMLDSGDFVLAASDGSVLWESFADPTDTILPTQSLAPNSNLVANQADDDFNNGRFKLAMHGDGTIEFFLIDVTTGLEYDSYWSFVSNVSNSQLVFNLTGTINLVAPTGKVLTTLTSATTKPTANFYHRGTLDSDGVFRHYVYPKANSSTVAAKWAVVDFKPVDICGALLTSIGSGACGFNSFCGNDSKERVTCECLEGYSWVDSSRSYLGCKPNFSMPSCISGGQSDGFQIVTVDNLNLWGTDYARLSPMTATECEQQCLDDCFCAAAIYDGTSTCWKKKLPFSNGVKGSSIIATALIKVGSNGTQLNPSPGKKSTWVSPGYIALGGSMLLNFIFLSGTLLFLSVKRRKQRKGLKDSILGLNLKFITYRDLEDATRGFGEEIGRGACGTVYKGYLGAEQTGVVDIAVKKLRDFQPEMEKEFINEVKTIGQTHHKNLVRLLGYCNQGAERLLVYEYMSNGSLASYLFGSTRPPWEQRIEIMFGIARGLRYLHGECSTQIIHCDIKPQNILLDDNFVARIADFGLAKLLRTDQTRTNTGIRGTKGYVAPEWFKNSGISAKVDVYSFGVMALEIVCCRRNVEKEMTEEKAVLCFWASDCHRAGRVDLLVEGDEEAMADMGNVERFVMVALCCVQEEPSLRPTMAQVTQMLDEAVGVPAVRCRLSP